MSKVISATGPRYDVRPSGENRGVYGGPARSLACMIKDAMQGAGAGFLSLTGATSIVSGETMASGGDLGLLSAVFPSLAASGMTGPMQLIGGVVLFLAARRTISRTTGLMVFIAFMAAIANGYSLTDMLSLLSNLLQSAAGALEQSPAATNV